LAALGGVNRRTAEVLQLCGLQGQHDVAAGALGYAAQRALELGITIAGAADVLLLDEPTAGMSRDESVQALALIRRVSHGKTLLLIEQAMEVVFGLADRIAVLVQGRIIACDTPAAIRHNRLVQEPYLGAQGAGLRS
jgi:branched-chain amino acid transport system ATP-binding protein